MGEVISGRATGRRSVRLRLTLLLGGLFVVGGAALLATTYVLVERATGDPTVVATRTRTPPVPRDADRGAPEPTADDDPLPDLEELPEPQEDSPAQQAASVAHDDTMHQLAVQSGIALGMLAVVASAAGWFVAGRLLAPVRRIAETTRRISQDNLDERLALPGPADELTDLADTIDELLARLDRAFDAQRRFVANASHELRTPLAMMRTSLDVAAAKPGPTRPAAMRTLDTKLREGLDQADHLIEGFLALARAEQGDRVRQTVALDEAVTTVLHQRQAAVADEGIEVQVTIDPVEVTGGEVLLTQLVENLVDNAIDHNRPGGWLHLSTGHDDTSAWLRIANGGAPLDAARVAELTQPFRRLGKERTGSRTGFGLGLSIVAAIVDAHDGTLTLRPGDEEGLEVEVRLPLAVREGTEA